MARPGADSRSVRSDGVWIGCQAVVLGGVHVPLVDLDVVAEPERARHVLAEVIEASTARRPASPGGDRDDRRQSPRATIRS